MSINHMETKVFPYVSGDRKMRTIWHIRILYCTGHWRKLFGKLCTPSMYIKLPLEPKYIRTKSYFIQRTYISLQYSHKICIFEFSRARSSYNRNWSSVLKIINHIFIIRFNGDLVHYTTVTFGGQNNTVDFKLTGQS